MNLQVAERQGSNVWEDLRVTILLELSGFHLERNFEDTLNQYFIENPEDELLLELEFISADLNKARGVLNSGINRGIVHYDMEKSDAMLYKRLEELYNNTSLEEFAPCASKLCQMIGGDLSYADEAFAKKDMARADAIYREMFRYHTEECDKESHSEIVCKTKINIQEYVSASQDNVKPDFEKAEMFLGFRLNESVKNFYSRVYAKAVDGTVVIPEKDFTVPIGNKRFDAWFRSNGIKGRTDIRLFPCTNEKTSARFIRDRFYSWTGGNDFGQRVYIGEFFANIGQITIVINNQTGAVEWVDCEYGHYEKYEKNPHGILAENMYEFLQKIVSASEND